MRAAHVDVDSDGIDVPCVGVRVGHRPSEEVAGMQMVDSKLGLARGLARPMRNYALVARRLDPTWFIAESVRGTGCKATR